SIDDHGTRTQSPAGTIRFAGITFAYPSAIAQVPTEPRTAAIAGATFEVRPGETLGIVGPTGAGKSTLLHLLLRHYALSTGTIRWGEFALTDYTLASLRAAIAWVPQEAFLFSATIADNIALVRAGVARLADLHADIQRSPRGYDTMVGERGITLSGGQRQRVAIARALLADAPL